MTRKQFIIEVESTQRAFRRFLVALCCGDSSLADDVAQEAYIKAYLACDSIRNAERFKAWIYRIAYTTYLNQRRADKPTYGYDDVQPIAGNSKADGAFAYEGLHRALNLLPAKERTAVLLFYMENYSIAEISEIVGASQESVKQRLGRGRMHLRHYLSNSENAM